MAKIENIECLWGFSHGLGVFIVNRNDKTLYGLINAAGEIILEPQPKELTIRNEKQVMLLRDGDIILNFIPQSKVPTSPNEKKVIQVHNKHKKGDKDIVLNLETGKTFFAEYSYPEKFDNAITWQESKGYGAVDIDGNTIIPNKYLVLKRVDNSLFAAKDRAGKCGFIDKEGKETCEFVYDSIAAIEPACSSDMISVRQGTEWFVVDRSGRQLTRRRGGLSEDYHLMAVTPRGYAIFCEKRHKRTYYGLLDVAKDEIVIPAEYSKLYWLDRYPGGWTRLGTISDSVDSQSDERGVLTLGGDVLKKIDARDYYEGNYIVCRDRVDGVVNEAGRTIIPFDFRCINREGEVYTVSRSDTKLFGIYSLSGDVILPCEYDYIDIGDTLDYIAVCKNGEWYYVNQHGERVLL